MDITVADSVTHMAQLAATTGAAAIREALDQHRYANIIVATGASQLQMLEHLTQEKDIRWDRVTIFHLDEYIGLPITHPASFRNYLWTRFHSKLPVPPRAFHYLDGEHDALAECSRVASLIQNTPVHVAFIGIGENGHVAFNDPPADFQTDAPYLIVDLDEACRKQQQGEGWFKTLNDVPTRAISMSVKQIMKSHRIICTVPDERKANAVKHAVHADVSPQHPATILQQHPDCRLFLDPQAASLLPPSVKASQG